MGTGAEDCVFCEIVAGNTDDEIIFETEGYLCIRDKHEVTTGHVLVLPKAHVESLVTADWEPLVAVVKQAVETVRARRDPDGINVGCNVGEAAGQTVPHLHWHIIPRFEGDCDDPRGGVRGVIPERQQYVTEQGDANTKS